MMLVDVYNLKPGMVVNKDVENLKTGVILVKGGTVLNRRLILLIRNMGIRKIETLDEEIFLEEHPEERLIINYEILSDKTEKIFNDIKFGKKILISEISEEMDMLINELIKNKSIVKLVM